MKYIGLIIVMIVIFVSTVRAQSPSTTLKPMGFYIGFDYHLEAGEFYDVIDYENSIKLKYYDFTDMMNIYLGYKTEIFRNINLYGEFIFGRIIFGFNVIRARTGIAFNISTGFGNISFGLEPLLTFNPFNINTLNFIIGLDAGYYGGAIKIIKRIESPDLIESIEPSVFIHSKKLYIGIGLAVIIPIANNNKDSDLIIIPEITLGGIWDLGGAKAYIQFPIKEQVSMGNNYWPTGISFGFRLNFGSSKR